MFDLFGPSPSALQAAMRSNAENMTAIAMILIEKGICTEEEFEAARLRAISILDQAVAERRTEADEQAEQAAEFFGRVVGGGPTR